MNFRVNPDQNIPRQTRSPLPDKTAPSSNDKQRYQARRTLRSPDTPCVSVLRPISTIKGPEKNPINATARSNDQTFTVWLKGSPTRTALFPSTVPFLSRLDVDQFFASEWQDSRRWPRRSHRNYHASLRATPLARERARERPSEERKAADTRGSLFWRAKLIAAALSFRFWS